MRTLVKITGKNKEIFNHNLNSAINVAALCAKRGVLPKEVEIQKEGGDWWVLNEEQKVYNLNPNSNNHQAFIREKGENHILLEFFYRSENKLINPLTFQKTMAELVVVMLGQDNAEIITK